MTSSRSDVLRQEAERCQATYLQRSSGTLHRCVLPVEHEWSHHTAPEQPQDFTWANLEAEAPVEASPPQKGSK